MLGGDQFGRYEQDLLTKIKTTKTILADRLPISEKEEKKSLIRQVTKDIDEMNNIIGEMERELNKAGPNSRTSMSSKLKQYKRDIEIIEKDLKKTNSMNNMYNNYGASASNFDNNLDPERQKVLQIHNTLIKTTDSIARSTQIAVETERIGTDVLTELNQQGEQLKRANEILDDTNMSLSKSRRLINKLSTNIFCNKFVLVILVIVELLILGGVIYWKFFTK